MAKKDYSMGFKNRDIDRFSNKFGKNDGGDKPKKTDNGKSISKDDKIFAKVKARAANERELESLQKARPTKAGEKRKEELKGKLGITQAEKQKRTVGSPTAPSRDEIRQGNIDRIKKKIAEMDAKAKKNGTINLPAYKEQVKKLTDQIATIQSRMGK